VEPRRLVDRTAKENLTVAPGNAQTLRIEVDKGNDVGWCDWFTIGFPEVQMRSRPGQEG
jgi:hypothetical protein